MIVIAFNILKRGEEYVELGADHFDRRNKQKTVSRLVQRLTRLGYQVTLSPIPADGMPVDENPKWMSRARKSHPMGPLHKWEQRSAKRRGKGGRASVPSGEFLASTVGLKKSNSLT